MAAHIKIAWKSVTKRFGENAVLDRLDLEAHEGRSLVVIGGSGTGKSVTLKTALGLIAPDRGHVEIDGQKVRPGDPSDPGLAQIGMLFQSGALFDSLTVWENIAFKLIKAGGVKRSEARTRAIEALAQVDLDADVINRLIVRQVKSLGATAVTITHDMASMRLIADEVAMIENGRIRWRGGLDGIESCADPAVCAFVQGRSVDA